MAFLELPRRGTRPRIGVARARAEGIDASGPFSPDTACRTCWAGAPAACRPLVRNSNGRAC